MAEGHLERILKRKRGENARRARFREVYHRPLPAGAVHRVREATEFLRRAGSLPHVIAEVKFRSPSAGKFRDRSVGDAIAIAGAYERGGARALSVLADGPGFGGSPLTVRRVASACDAPVLYKGFVLEELQLDVAVSVGARYVLLIVRALEQPVLRALVHAAKSRGLAPVVEAADAPELERALETDASIIGFNARDLSTFNVDPAAARELVEEIPPGRVAVYMSGIRSAADLEALAAGRADAALVGEGLMREGDPEATLRTWLAKPRSLP